MENGHQHLENLEEGPLSGAAPASTYVGLLNVRVLNSIRKADESRLWKAVESPVSVQPKLLRCTWLFSYP